MGISAGIMQVGGVVSQGVNAYGQSRATKTSAEIQASVDRTNAILSENQANDAITRGNKLAIQERLKTAQLRARQKVAFAANGVVADSGTSAGSILNDTELLGSFDENTIIQNAQREAFGYRTQARNYRDDASIAQARGEMENPFISGASALLTGSARVADNWYRYTRTKG
jgi:hypothetical protein